MTPFKHHIGYLADWLNRRTKTSRISEVFFWFAFTLAFIIASTGSNNSPSVTPPWPCAPIYGHIQNLIAYDKDGTIFVAVDSDVYKYSNQLQILTRTPASTSNITKSNETIPIDLLNKFLLIATWNDKDVLLSCWQTFDNRLDCWLNKLDDLKSGLHLLWAPGNKGFKTDSANQIKALGEDSSKLVFATSGSSSAEDNSSNIQLPAISRFKITTGLKSLFLEQKAVLAYKTQSKDSFLSFDYVYLFNFNNYTHFILNDHQQPMPSSSNREAQHHIRLAKICNNDTELTSYTEISITCNNLNNIYAKYAYFELSKKEPMLYIIFEALEDLSSTPRKSNEKSHLCSYSMKLIEDIFYNAIADCHKGDQNSKLLSKLHPDLDQPPLCQRNPSNDWCSSKLNPYIDGSSYRYQVTQDSYLSLDGLKSVNFFYPIKQGLDQKEIVFIGTESGLLTKMSFDEDLLYTIDLNTNLIKNYQLNEKFQIKIRTNHTHGGTTTRYAINSNKITAISNNVIHQLNIDECYYYRTCKACLSTRDPLNCDWCANSCTRKQDCVDKKDTDLSCSPTIKDILPRYGPTTGHTKLRIQGENLGSPKGSLIVRLDKQDCLINHASSSDDVIECLTKPVEQSTNATLTVDVLDESGPIASKGTVSTHNSFAFVEALVYGIHPTSGSHTGGNPVNLYGENLDVGNSRIVLLGENECSITNITRNKIICLTSPFNEFKIRQHQPVKFLIDTQEQKLAPKLTSDGFNISMSYLLINDLLPPKEENSIIHVNNTQDFEEGSYSLFLIITVLTLITIVILFFLFKEKLPRLKIKLPQPFEMNEDKFDDSKVSFRNPQSMRFGSTNVDGASSTGLVKLNGSVISTDYFGKQDQIDQDQPLMNNFLDNELLSLLIQEKILIDRSRLTLGHVLGSGQFGRVYKGFLKDQSTGEHVAVAVKTLHNRSSWDDGLDNRAFLEEGLMMRDFEHENVLALIGVTFDSNGLPMVVTPFMLYGDLRSYISDEASSPTVKELIDFGTQVARGMAYLSGLKFVHRDLAARNCMLDDNLVVKVADFGLSRDIYERDYYSSDNKKTKLPVKWMAVESLEKCIYNTKTDVWSYGILLWELMTRGVVPYPDVDNFDLFSYLKEGRRMLRPRYCPLILYKVMLSCWNEDPLKRPTFDELVIKVSDVINQLKIAKDGQQKVSRDVTYCDVLK